MYSLAIFGVLSALRLCFAAPPCGQPMSGVVDAKSFAEEKFDYLVIGSGAGGMTVANRLSENPSIKVGVLEAGFLHYGDPLIDTPANILALPGNPLYDWNYVTTPQSGANGRVLAAPRGRILGGSTGINQMAWDRASIASYAGWSSIAGGGWTFDDLLPYMRRSEMIQNATFDPFPGLSSRQHASYSAEASTFDGFSGPIKGSHNVIYTSVVEPYVVTVNSLGLATSADYSYGNTTGIWNLRDALDREEGIRSYAAYGYYCPASQRPNLKVLTGAQATRIILSKDETTLLCADGVEFVVNGSSHKAYATREVILSAGAVQTPQLLELSGVGNATFLGALGINSTIDLPGVGENLLDQIFVPNQFQVVPGVQTFDELNNNATFAAMQATLYNDTHTGWLAATDTAVIFSPLQGVTDEATLSALLTNLETSLAAQNLTPLQQQQAEIQLPWLHTAAVPATEIILWSRGIIAPQPNTSYFSVLSGLLQPFSRGTIHINTTNPLAAPVIDPRYLSNEVDVQILLASTKFVLKAASTSPLSDIVTGVSYPPVNSTDADVLSWVVSTFLSGSHLMGTAAMAPRAIGGVVDNALKVYGTRNLRVVDASVIPISLDTHPQATVYAIGEKAAAMIALAVNH